MRAILARLCAVGLVCGLGIAKAEAGMLWVSDANGKLASVDTQTWQVSVKGQMNKVMTDIAMTKDGQLYGIDYENMYQVNKRNGYSYDITRGTGDMGNALAVVDDTLYSLKADYLMVLDSSTGQASKYVYTGRYSSGDLAAYNGKTYMVSYYTHNNNYTNVLAEIDLNTGRVTDVGSLGRMNVYGLAEADGKLYAASENVIYEVDPLNAQMTAVRTLHGIGQVWGMTSMPEVSVVPEPASMALIGLGGLLVLMRRRG